MIATYLREQGYDVEVLRLLASNGLVYSYYNFFIQRVREDTLVVGISGMFALLDTYG